MPPLPLPPEPVPPVPDTPEVPPEPPGPGPAPPVPEMLPPAGSTLLSAWVSTHGFSRSTQPRLNETSKNRGHLSQVGQIANARVHAQRLAMVASSVWLPDF